MKNILFKTKAFLLALCIGWGVLATSCINEDLDGCYTLTVKVLNLQGDDITESGEEVNDASVFIFDEGGKYLETVKLSREEIMSRTPIQINYPVTTKLQIVVWGNVAGEEQTLVSGQTIDDLKVQLKRTNNYANNPAELYFGDDDVPLRAGTLTKNEEVPIQLCVGQLRMWTEGLHYYLAKTGLRADEVCDFYFEKALDELNSKGEIQGNDATYAPEGEWSEGLTEWEMPEMETIFPGEMFDGSFYLNGVHNQTRNEDYRTGQPLEAKAGHETLVVFQWGEDGTFLGIKVKVRPWGYVEDDIEW